jgi:hypothetical protein
MEPAPYGYLIIAGRTTVVGDATVNAGALADSDAPARRSVSSRCSSASRREPGLIMSLYEKRIAPERPI